jgi:hypothetical protein
MGDQRRVTTVEAMMRRRAANALLSTAAALARLADDLDELAKPGRPQTAEHRGRIAALRQESEALRCEYQAALYRYRAVAGIAAS